MGPLLNRHIRVTPQTSVYSCRWTKTSQSVYTNTHTGTHSLVFIRQCWHSALRRRHSSRAQRRAGSADERQKETKKNSQNKKKEAQQTAGRQRTQDCWEINVKKRVPRLWSTPRWERRSRILLLIATGSTCLSVCPSFCLPGALSVCLPGISTSLCVWCLIFYKPLCAGHFPFFLTS